MPLLTTENGPNPGRQYKLETGTTVIGRHPECDVVVDVGAVSRHHAQVMEIGGQFYLEDLNSRNGTFVNGDPVSGRHRLEFGDRIQVCDVNFRFRDVIMPMTMDDEASSVLITEFPKDSSRIMSRLDVLGGASGSVAIATTPEAKLKALIDISRSLSKSLSIEEVLPTVLDSLFRIFVQADRGFVILPNDEGTLIPRHTKLRRGDDDKLIRISKTIVDQVVESKQALLSTDTMDDQRFALSESIADFRIRSFICAPLLDSESNVLGVIQLDSLDHRNRFKPEDLDLLASVAGQAGIAVENANLHDEVVQMRVLERDMELASQVQQSFLPQNAPKPDRYEFTHYYQPADKVGGDYYDYVSLPDGRIAVVLADVVGHGMAASLQTAQLSAALKFSLATNTDPAAAINELNQTLSEGSLPGRFITFCMLVFHPECSKMTIVNAGHMPPLLIRGNEEPHELGKEVRQFPLLIVDDHEYESVEVDLQDGDRVVMYTDGINESINASDELYGVERLVAQVRGSQSGVELTERLIDDVRHFAGGVPQKDDMCLVCCTRSVA